MNNWEKTNEITSVEQKEKTKVCTKCGKEKPLSEFNLKKNGPCGRQYWCRECQKENYKENFDHIKEQRKMKKVTNDTKIEDMFEAPLTLLPKSLSIPVRKPVEPDPLPAPKTPAEILSSMTTSELMRLVKNRKDFNMKDMFTPRELMKGLYDHGYRGSLDIMVKQTVTLSAQD